MTFTTLGRLAPTPPFDFTQSLGFLEGFPPTQGEQTLAPQTLTKAVFVGGQVVVFQVVARGSIEEPGLGYKLWSAEPITPKIQQDAEDRITFFLGLGDDLRPFYAVGEQDGAFASVLKRRYGYHQVKFLTPFENACWAVLTQRTPMAVARKLKQALVEAFGGSLEVGDETYWAFPEPARLAMVEPEHLVSLVINERRAAYLHAVATAFASIDEHWLRKAPTIEVITWLRAIKGIGAWSAEFIALRGLGHMDILPSTEERLMEMAKQVYGPNTDRAGLEHIAAQYHPWEGYWAHYLRVGG